MCIKIASEALIAAGQECVTDFAAQEKYLQSAVAQGSGSPEQLAALAALRKQTE